ncbi:hypothetical protein TEQG_04390 [Trichophyton equinum CBS 127.97]|uniref:Uncharacterized protein n=1 Tax=Trichophyton equinum (strain ATCC MYA-4606 / CBS 127.97) TaxID=559882 RepID=F2PTL5_TRIEC|nr:hypothetical protein TEQG_04390 [Trichophyton equinum CBS 127.97]
MSSSAVPRQAPGTSTATMSTPGSTYATFDAVRCSRCQLSLSSPGSKSVQFGVNCYYCNRCYNIPCHVTDGAFQDATTVTHRVKIPYHGTLRRYRQFSYAQIAFDQLPSHTCYCLQIDESAI